MPQDHPGFVEPYNETHASGIERLERIRPGLETRAKVLAAIRSFFADRDFLEVETPIHIRTPALELHIDAIATEQGYLRTSPELHMKRMLAAGYERIFQVGSCFRAGESGSRHRPEYTMLEWYRAFADYKTMLADAKELILHIARSIGGTQHLSYQGQPLQLGPRWELISVRQAFIEHAGWDPVAAFDQDRFDVDLVEKVEPSLPVDVPVVLIDYPVQAAALAKRSADGQTAERWELYIAGLELANAYSELTDPVEQRTRFESCARERADAGRTVYDIDEPFLQALVQGMPASGGIALGVDRLVMLFADASDIDDVMSYQESP